MDEQKNEVTEVEVPSYQNNKERLLALINGFFVGLAIIVPGVSGSTISMIFKLYDKMMDAIAKIFKRFKKSILFLLPIVIGAIIGFVGGFFAVQSFVDSYTFICVALFAGLMLGGASEVHDEIRKEKGSERKWYDYLLLGIGFLFPIAIGLVFYYGQEVFSLTALFSGNSFPWYTYLIALLLGAVISLTQIVPGLSATALLMCFGIFTPIMNSVSLTVWGENPMWFLVYVCLAIGFLIGLFFFSKGMNHFLTKKRFSTFHLLTGLTYGSIFAMFMNTEIIAVYQSYQNGTGNLALDLGVGIPLFIVGFFITFLLIFYMKKKEKKEVQKE